MTVCRTVNMGFSSSEDLLGIGPASQHVFSADKTEALKAIGRVVAIFGLEGEEEFFLI